MIIGKKNLLFIVTLTILFGLIGTSLAKEVPDCLSCHGDVRHGLQNNTFCINCHINYQIEGDEHTGDIFEMIPFVHRTFDWEGDNQITAGLPEDESCPACHVSIHAMISARDAPELFRKCEDCHIIGGVGPASGSPGWNIRPDIDNFVLKVYAHYTGSDVMDVKDQSGVFNGTSISSCFDYNINTGEGTCHGVGEMFADEAGGYFAHVNDTEVSKVSGLFNNPSDPYEFDVTIDSMPDTSDCMFCHYQDDESIRLIWGGARQPVSDVHTNLTANQECWECHTKDGREPLSFHSDTMGDREEDSKALPWGTIVIGGAAVIAIGGAAYYFSVIRKK